MLCKSLRNRLDLGHWDHAERAVEEFRYGQLCYCHVPQLGRWDVCRSKLGSPCGEEQMADHALGKLNDSLSLREHPQIRCGCVACVLVQALPVHLV